MPAIATNGKCAFIRRTTQAQRPGPRDAWIAIWARWLGSLQHGHSPNGVQVPWMKTRNHENEYENTSRSQGAASDRRSERRLGKTRVPMNKNLIEGRCDGASWHHPAKPTGEVVEVNQAVVRGRTVFFPGEVSPVRAGEKSAEVIVVGDKPGAGRCPLQHEHRNP